MKIFTGKELSFHAKGKLNTVDITHPRFDDIMAACDAGDYDKAYSLVSLRETVEKAVTGTELKLQGSRVLYKNRELPESLGKRIITLNSKGMSVTALVKFAENLFNNPSFRAVQELYDFLEASRLPITDDGHFLAYKSVTPEFKDHHTETMDNSVGAVVEMPRNEVNEDKDQTCSTGLHFAAYNYASNFNSYRSRLVTLKINPADVVSIPSDYNNEKGRCCKYVVLDVAEGDTLTNAEVVELKPAYTPLVNNYGDSNVWQQPSFYEWPEFIGEPWEFPVNRKSVYDLTRHSNDKEYEGYFFTKYDEANENLVFKSFNGAGFDWVTVADLDDWTITLVDQAAD